MGIRHPLEFFQMWKVPMERKNKLVDVAAAANVSPTTVSRYMNGTLHLSERTQIRVDTAIEKLSYMPDPHARRLSTGKSDTFALILPDIANPFFSKIAASIEIAAANAGYMVVLFATFNEESREISALELALQNKVAGVFFATNHRTSSLVAQLLNKFERVVILDEDVLGTQAPKLRCDNVMGGELAGKYLRGQGHRNVAYIGGGKDLLSTYLRLKGLENGLLPKGNRNSGLIRHYVGDHDINSGKILAKKFLTEVKNETAIFVGSDELTIGVLTAFKELGVKIPDEFSLISFDGVQNLKLFQPAITNVVQPVESLGKRAVEIILNDDRDQYEAGDYLELVPVSLNVEHSVSNLKGN